MKFAYALALALAGVAVALPAAPPKSGQIVSDLGPEVKNAVTVIGTDSKELLLQLSPEVTDLAATLGLVGAAGPLGSVIATASSVGDLLNDESSKLENTFVAIGEDGSALLIQLSPSLASTVGSLLPPLAEPVGQIITTVGDHVKRAEGTGQLLTDVGKQVDGVLTIAGPAAQTLLIELSPEVAALLSGLGLPPVGALAGSVVATASSAGALVADLGPKVDGTLIVVEHGTQFLLVSLSPVVAGLVSGLGLPAVGVSVGTVVDTLAANL